MNKSHNFRENEVIFHFCILGVFRDKLACIGHGAVRMIDIQERLVSRAYSFCWLSRMGICIVVFCRFIHTFLSSSVVGIIMHYPSSLVTITWALSRVPST